MPSRSDEESKVRRLIELKEWVEKKLGELKAEVEGLQALSSILAELIAEKSFQPASTTVAAEREPSEKVEPKVEGIPIRYSDGTLLATVHSEDGRIRVIFSEDVELREDIPPFRAFLVRKVLEPMTSRDLEAVSRGVIPPDEAFNYEIKVEDGVLKELILHNVRDSSRVRDFRSALRWTLERMYEKILK